MKKRALAISLLSLAPWGSAAAQAANEDLVLVASDGAASDFFGAAVSINGERLLIAAPLDDDGADRSGAVYVYERQGPGDWMQSAKLAAPTPKVFHQFGTSVDLDGERALIGAVNLEDSPAVPGKAYVYVRQSDGSWSLEDDIDVPAPSATEAVVTFVALDGERALIGSVVIGDHDFGRSSAQLFERQSAGNWTLQSVLVGPDAEPLEWFGAAVALDGDRALVGAEEDDLSGLSAGAAHVFERQGDGSWTLGASLLPSAPRAGSFFGSRVALDGTRALVGAVRDGSMGAAYVFERQGDGSWLEAARLSASDAAPNGGFGADVALEGNRAIVGATRFGEPGKAYLFERRADGTWKEIVLWSDSNALPGDRLGHAVDLDAQRAVFGAPSGTGLVSGSGVADLITFGTLYHGTPELSLASGGAQTLMLRAGPAQAGGSYVMLGSASGTSPGIVFPAAGLILPLVPDFYFQFLVQMAGGGVLQPYLGFLDSDGSADVTFQLPLGLSPTLAGTTLHHAALSFQLTPNFTPVFVSTPAALRLLP